MAAKHELRKKKGIIFDLDDTLAKTKFGKTLGLKRAALKIHTYLRKKGVSVALSNLYKKIKDTVRRFDEEGMYNRNSWWRSAIKDFLNDSPKESFLTEVTMTYWNGVMERSELYKDALPLLSYLKAKGYLLGMVSDTDGVKDLKTKRIAQLSLLKWFDSVVVAGDDVKHTKPHKSPFFLIAKKLRLKPEQCAFVGNNIYMDILGAKKANMASILVKRDERSSGIKPDLTVTNLRALKKIF